MQEKKRLKLKYQMLKDWLVGTISIDRLCLANIEEYYDHSFHPSETRFVLKKESLFTDHYYECLTGNSLAFREKEDRPYHDGEAILTNITSIVPYLTEEELMQKKVKRYRLQEIFYEANHLPFDKDKTPIAQLTKLELKR